MKIKTKKQLAKILLKVDNKIDKIHEKFNLIMTLPMSNNNHDAIYCLNKAKDTLTGMYNRRNWNCQDYYIQQKKLELPRLLYAIKINSCYTYYMN